jgi:hypothetical protein
VNPNTQIFLNYIKYKAAIQRNYGNWAFFPSFADYRDSWLRLMGE